MSVAPEMRLVLRPRGVLESADLAMRLLTLHARAFARLAVAVCVPGFVFTLALRYAFALEPWVVWLAGVLLAGWAEGPFTVLAGAALRRTPSGRTAWAEFAARAVPYVRSRTLAFAGGLLAAAALLVPWLFAAPSLLFVPEVVLLERADRKVFTRAARIVASAAGRATATAFLLLVVRVGAVVSADLVLRRSLGMALDVHARFETLARDGIGPYAIAGLWLSVPVCAMLRYVAYVDLRTLREGWDVQRRFEDLAAQLAKVHA